MRACRTGVTWKSRSRDLEFRCRSADLRLLRRTVRIAQALCPPLRRQQPDGTRRRNLSAFLHAEIDMRHEARRTCAAWPGAGRAAGHRDPPCVVEPLVARDDGAGNEPWAPPLNPLTGPHQAPALAEALRRLPVPTVRRRGFHADPASRQPVRDGRRASVLPRFRLQLVCSTCSRLAFGRTAQAIVATIHRGAGRRHRLGLLPRPCRQRQVQREIDDPRRWRGRPLTSGRSPKAVWRVARIGHGTSFRLPAHLLV